MRWENKIDHDILGWLNWFRATGSLEINEPTNGAKNYSYIFRVGLYHFYQIY